MADNNNPIKYSDLISPDDSITKLISQLDQLSDAYMNALKNVKSEAITVKAALEGVSGATENGRKTIRNASNDTDKLTRAAKELAFAESENAKRLAELKLAQKEANDLNKLMTKLNQSAEGSYNRLSAQYSINKIYLNNMTVEEREATEEGRKLVEETRAIYEEMKRLQEATGKTSLNVGNYEQAAEKLSQQVEKMTKQLALMRLEGKQGTAEYQELAKRASELKDAFADASQEIQNMASDTSNLDAVLGAAGAASGGMAVFTGAMELFGSESEDVQEAQKKLQAVIAVTTGVQAIQNAVQRQSALMLGISRLQMAALSKAQVYNRLVTIQGTKATLAATVAQKAFNLVASANPYVLLAVALVTVVGALVAFSKGSDEATERQKKLNEQQIAWLDYLDEESKEMNRVSDERVAQLNRELNLAKARNAGLEETRKIEDEILIERENAHSRNVGLYGQEIDALEENRIKVKQLRDMLQRLRREQAQGAKDIDSLNLDIDLDGEIDKGDIDKAIESVQTHVDKLGKEIEIAVALETEGADLYSERKILMAKRLEEDKQNAKNELEIVRKTEDAKISLIKNSFEQQRIQYTTATNRAIQEIQYQLNNETNLTVKARKALNEQIVLLRQQLADNLVAIANEQREKEIAVQRTTEEFRLDLMMEGATKQREQLRIEYERQIEDITRTLEIERGLTETEERELTEQRLLLEQQYAKRSSELEDQITLERMQKEAARTQLQLDAVREGSQEEINLRIQLIQQQRQIELAQNRQLAEDVRQAEKDINAKYDAEVLKQTTELNQQRALMLFDQMQELDASEFDLIRNSEERKTRFKLEQERARLKKILELNENAGIKMSDVEVQTIKNTIAKIDQEIQQSKKDERGKDIYGLFGLNLNDKQKEAISTSISFAKEQLNSFFEAKLQIADAAVAASDKEVEATQRRLDAELEARANGYANNVTMAQKELDAARKNQQKALQEQRKAQKQQAAIQALEQVTNLVTATAKIWGSLGGWPPAAIAATALMWSSFAASKVKAAQLTKNSTEEYGDGTVELLQGGSHQSGNDIDLGTKPDGTKRRAEGGEYFAVINKRNSRKFRKHIPSVINALNNGTFADKYLNAYSGANDVQISVNQESAELKELNDSVREIKEQNRRKTYVDGDGNLVVVYKNKKRIYKNK